MSGGSSELKNLARLNIWRVINDREARDWQSFVCGKEAVAWEMIHQPKCHIDTFLNLS